MSDQMGSSIKQNILIVDDDPVLLKSLHDLLSIKGYSPHTASGGQEAKNKLKENYYDLILLDLNMPHVNGYDLLKYIRKNKINSLVIIISGESSFESAKNVCSLGVYDYLCKPYAIDELIITINNALKEKFLQKQHDLIQEKLYKSEQLYRYMVDTSPDIIYMLDQNGNFTFVNERTESLLGFSKEEILGRNYSFLLHPDDLQRAQYAVNERRVSARATKNVELRFVCKGDSNQSTTQRRYLPIELTTIGMYSEKHASSVSYTGTYGVARDITERKIAAQTITFQAYHDPLTKLPNRTLLRDRLTQAIKQAKREKENFAVMFLDLDRFKNINDSLGHIVGDELLQKVSARLIDCIREGDTLARFGGDEFTFILPRLNNSQEDASKLATKILKSVKRPFIVDNRELYISASIGIAIYPQHGENHESLIKHADVAMYHVKGRGKNGFQFYAHDMNGPYLEQLSLETGINNALKKNEFELVFQPQLNLNTGKTVGVETLLRWNHPKQGIIYPSEFIPFAEESGLIIDIGSWVIKTACAEFNRWRRAGMINLRLAINISTRQLMQDNIVKEIIDLITTYNIPGECLELEITENAIMDDLSSVVQKLSALRAHNINIAIDDFGTGYSSLNYLHELPIQTLKIDRTFLKEDLINKGSKTIINTIVAMAKVLDLNVIAEGVESQVQLDYLRDIECYEAQGYLLGRPIPSEEFCET